MTSSVQAVVHQLDKDLPLYAVRTMDQMLDTSMARERMSMSIFVVFAAVALTLASVGLYGVVAHGVTERTHEIGVRMALGAEPRHVRRLVVRQGLSMALVGMVIGLAGAMALSRSVQGLLFGVTATDPITFASGRRRCCSASRSSPATSRRGARLTSIQRQRSGQSKRWAPLSMAKWLMADGYGRWASISH